MAEAVHTSRGGGSQQWQPGSRLHVMGLRKAQAGDQGSVAEVGACFSWVVPTPQPSPGMEGKGLWLMGTLGA